jgi:two-component system NtrC family sensor kinase
MARALRRNGFQVDTAAGGALALEQLVQAHYDLILCDMRMPDMSGANFYQQVKERFPELAQRILFATGDSGSQATRRFIEQTGAAYITKPFELSELIERVKKVIG